MRRDLPCVLAGIVTLTCACSPPRPTLAPSAILEATNRLATAGNLLRQGCFDCLIEALREYDAIRGQTNLPVATVEAATIGSIQGGLLLALRARELGTIEGEYLQRARRETETREDLRHTFSSLIEGIEAMPSDFLRFHSLSDLAARRREVTFREKLPAFLAEQRQHADRDPLTAYVWVAFSCTFGDYDDQRPEALLAPLGEMRGIEIVTYRIATCRGADGVPVLEDLLKREPRFTEVNFWLGQQAVARLQLEEAESLFLRAYTWRPGWPAVTVALANLYFAFEEPGRALTFYDQTLVMMPGFPDAMLGRVKTLSLLGRHDEAFDAIDLMVGGSVRILPGEAYYWRAWNDLQVDRLEDAWIDIEEANRLWTNSEVSKLGGIVAYRRQDFGTARQRFEMSGKLNPGDCETAYYLGLVHAEQREWTRSADIFVAAASCFETARRSLQNEIDAIRQSALADERTTRQIAKRERQVMTAGRMLATSWFNTAVAYFNLSRFAEARPYAEKVVDDDQFGDRARDLMRRMGSH